MLDTKTSQEAVCSRASAAIVPGRAPESHDAGVSRFGENGSHLEAADVAEGHAGQVVGPGSSRNAGTGSHLETTDVAEGHAGQVDGPGSSRNAGTGSHLEAADVAEGLAGQVKGSGSSRNTETGSHLEAADVAEGHAGQVGGPGSSRNAGTGSHLEAADVAEGHAGQVVGPGAAEMPKQAHTWWRRTSAMSPGGSVTAVPDVPYGNRPPVVRDALAEQCGTGNGPVVYARSILGAVAARGSGSSAGRHVERVRAQAETGGR